MALAWRAQRVAMSGCRRRPTGITSADREDMRCHFATAKAAAVSLLPGKRAGCSLVGFPAYCPSVALSRRDLVLLSWIELCRQARLCPWKNKCPAQINQTRQHTNAQRPSHTVSPKATPSRLRQSDTTRAAYIQPHLPWRFRWNSARNTQSTFRIRPELRAKQRLYSSKYSTKGTISKGHLRHTCT